MKTKTYQVIVKETIHWKVEVEETSHEIAKDMAVFKVSHNEYKHFPMLGAIGYSIQSSRIKPEEQ